MGPHVWLSYYKIQLVKFTNRKINTILLAYLTNKESKHKHAHEPGTCHEHIFCLILGFRVLANAGGCLGGKVETTDIPEKGESVITDSLGFL